MGRAALSLLAAAIATPLLVRAHPICHYGARNPVLDYVLEGSFCEYLHAEPDGFCCDEAEELAAKTRYGTAKLSGDCADYHKQVSTVVVSILDIHALLFDGGIALVIPLLGALCCQLSAMMLPLPELLLLHTAVGHRWYVLVSI